MNATTQKVRQWAMVGIVGGVATLVGGLTVQVLVVPRSTVAPELWTFPRDGGAFVVVTIVYAVFHAMVLAGLCGFRLSGLAGPGRGARTGHALALTGTALLAVAEVLSLFWVGQRTDAAGPGLTAVAFGLGTVLSAAGFVTLGVTTLRAEQWAGWRRRVPLVLGVWTTLLLLAVATPFGAAGIGIYGGLLALLFVALYTQPVAMRTTPVLGGAALRA
jgi:hypothetical protein